MKFYKYEMIYRNNFICFSIKISLNCDDIYTFLKVDSTEW